MENITISVDSDLLKKTRAAARRQAKSVNAFIRDLLKQNVEQTNFPEDYIALANSLKASSGGKKWTRESLYDR